MRDPGNKVGLFHGLGAGRKTAQSQSLGERQLHSCSNWLKNRLNKATQEEDQYSSGVILGSHSEEHYKDFLLLLSLARPMNHSIWFDWLG